MLSKHAQNIAIAFLLLFSFTRAAMAQRSGGTVWGVVTSEGKTLSGVSIQVSSDSLMQPRQTSTDAAGRYDFASLPPGTYEVHFEQSGMTSLNKPVMIRLGDVARVDAELKVSDSDETVTLTAAAIPAITRSSLRSVIDVETTEVLPIGRSIGQRVEPLVAGVWSRDRNASS